MNHCMLLLNKPNAPNAIITDLVGESGVGSTEVGLFLLPGLSWLHRGEKSPAVVRITSTAKSMALLAKTKPLGVISRSIPFSGRGNR